MDYRINQTVQTPLGVGQFMANYAVLDGYGVPVVKGRMVQVKLTDLKMAPTGRMLFVPSERGASLIDYALILAVIIVIILWAFRKDPL